MESSGGESGGETTNTTYEHTSSKVQTYNARGACSEYRSNDAVGVWVVTGVCELRLITPQPSTMSWLNKNHAKNVVYVDSERD